MKMLLILLLFQASLTIGKYVASDKSYDLFQEKLLHKSSGEIAHMFTVPPGEQEINLDFNFDSQEHSNIRRSADIRLRDEPLSSDDETNEGKTEVVDVFRFTKNLYECMIPEGEIKKPTTLAVISFLSSLNETDPHFEITEDRMKWFSIGDVKRNEGNNHSVFQIELLVIEGSNILSSASVDSLYEFVIEAKQNDMKVNSTVQVEILSLSPTTLRAITTTQQTTTSSNIIEGSGEEIEASGEAVFDDFTTSTIASELNTSAEVVKDQGLSHSVEASELLEGMKSEEMGSGESFEKNESLLRQQLTSSEIAEPNADDDQPLTENLTSVSTPGEDLAKPNDIADRRGIEILLNGTTNELYTISDQEHLSRGDLLKGLFFSLRINDEKSLKKVNLTIDRNDLFTIRPSRIPTNAKAYLFVNDVNIDGDITIKVTAEDEETGMTDIRNITIRRRSSEQSNKPKKSNQLTTVVFNVNENVPSGTTIGKIPDGTDMMVMSKASIFALVGEDLLLSCINELPCLDYEKQTVHYILLQNKNGSLPMMEVVVNVNDMNDHLPQLSMTDDIVRILDNRLIGAFAIEILDKDTMSPNEISLEGSASSFLSVESVDRNLYQLSITGNAKTGRHELQVILTDGSSRIEKTIRVIVLRGSSHAHFRRNRYERLVKIEQIKRDEELIRVELEGIPIDEARFVILKGNPGWIKMDDYGGSLIVSTEEQLTPSAQLTVGAISRHNGQLLAETVVVLNVVGVPENEKTDDVFVKKMYEKTLDRERSEKLEFELNVRNDQLDNRIIIKRNSIFALDENAQIKEIPSSAISIEGNKVILSKEESKDLRIVRFDIECKDQKATVVFHLNSSEDYVLHRKKIDNRPVFPSPWTFETQETQREISIPEELPIGQVILLAPALNPLTGKIVESRIVEGADDFKLDAETGAIHVVRQFDYDTMPSSARTKHLQIVAGDEKYESVFKAIIHITDIDDNAPVINRDGIPNQIILPENLPINTTLAKIIVTDIDEVSMSKGLKVTIEGKHSELYSAVVINGTIVVNVAGLLDREMAPSHSLTLSVYDSAGNEDYISMTVILFDENDNVPQFAHKSYNVQVVENWPSGLVVEQLLAHDNDVGANSELTFSLIKAEIDYFSINSTSGQLIIKQDLLGISREEPYVLKAMVEDNGNPSLNSTVLIRVKILEKVWEKSEGYIDFINPPLDFTSSLPENTKLNEVVYQAKAQVRTQETGRQHMHIKYSITENGTDSDIFKIDDSTGEIMLAKALDFELKRDHFCGVDNDYCAEDQDPTNQKLIEFSQKAMVRMIELGQKSNLQVSKKNPLGTLPAKLKKKISRENNEVATSHDHQTLPLPVLVKEHETIEITIDIHDSIQDEHSTVDENEVTDVSSLIELERIGSVLNRLENEAHADDSFVHHYADAVDNSSIPNEMHASVDFLEVQYMRSEIENMPMIDDFQELDQPSFRGHASYEKKSAVLSTPVVTRNHSCSDLEVPDCAKTTFTHVPLDGVPVSMADSESTNFSSSLQTSTTSCSTEKTLNEEKVNVNSSELSHEICDDSQNCAEINDESTSDVLTLCEDPKPEKAMSEASTNRTSSIELDEVDDSISSAPLPRLKIEDDEDRRHVESRESGYISSLSMGSPNNSFSYSTQNLHHLSPKMPRAKRFRQTHEEGYKMFGLQRATTTENLHAVKSKEEAMFDDFMKDTVYKTKYITSIFEVKNGGMEDVVDDILWEISKNISSNKMLVAACELHFSVPVDRRNRKTEYRLKTGLLSTLRINNQRLLSLKRDSRPAPLHLFESNTDENIRLNKDVKATQGVYLRVYKRLIEYAHKETTELHRPYWQLSCAAVGSGQETTLTPQPQRFLFDDDQKMDNLTNDTLVALIIKAEHLLFNSSSTRLWRVEVENVNDNNPVFINSSSFLFTLRPIVPIGRLSALDADGDPVYYQIIPSCSPYSKYFTIDEEFGEITFNRREDDIKEHRIYLCAIARSEKSLLDPELQFDSRRSDMIKFIVEKEHEQQFIIPDMTAYNNTIMTLDPLLQQVSIPVKQQSNPPTLVHWKLNSSIIRVQYTPCADMLPATSTKTALNQLFMLDEETNTVRVSPKLASEHDGIYKVSLATHSPNGTYMINQEYHLMNDARKSKFVFDLPASELSRNIKGFERRLAAALSSDHPDLPMKVVVDKPMSLNNNRTRSFVCFHTIKDGKIVSPNTALSSLSITNVGSVSHLAQLYSKYHIIDIQDCGEEQASVAAASVFVNPVMGLSTILIYTAICLSILLPFSLIIYCCAIRRYRDYIIKKEKSLKAPLSDVSPSPSLQPAPTFLLGPSAVTPMGPIGYWD